MKANGYLVQALDALQASMRGNHIGSCAVVYESSENLSEGVIGAFEAIRRLEHGIFCHLDEFGHYTIAGSSHKIDRNNLTGEIMLITQAGKLLVPRGVRVHISRYR